MKYDIKFVDPADVSSRRDNSQLVEVVHKISDEKSYFIDIPAFDSGYFIESMMQVFPNGTEYISCKDFIGKLVDSINEGQINGLKRFPNCLKEVDNLVLTDIEKYEYASSSAEYLLGILEYRIKMNKKTILVGNSALVSNDLKKLVNKLSKVEIRDNDADDDFEEDADSTVDDIVYKIVIEVHKARTVGT